jgi:hypothetical protein
MHETVTALALSAVTLATTAAMMTLMSSTAAATTSTLMAMICHIVAVLEVSVHYTLVCCIILSQACIERDLEIVDRNHYQLAIVRFENTIVCTDAAFTTFLVIQLLLSNINMNSILDSMPSAPLFYYY